MSSLPSDCTTCHALVKPKIIKPQTEKLKLLRAQLLKLHDIKWACRLPYSQLYPVRFPARQKDFLLHNLNANLSQFFQHLT
jgi:hypothetical protein